MTIYKIRYIAAILFIISPFVAFAQQQAGDSISIFELIDAVEKTLRAASIRQLQSRLK